MSAAKADGLAALAVSVLVLSLAVVLGAFAPLWLALPVAVVVGLGAMLAAGYVFTKRALRK